jgi:predicted acyltransferase
MGGWALCIFGIFYFLIDAKGIKKWANPFVVYGMNAIFVFVLSGIVAKTIGMWKFYVQLSDGTYANVSIKNLIMQNIFEPYFSPINASLAFAISFIAFMYFIVWFMYRKKIFIKV